MQYTIVNNPKELLQLALFIKPRMIQERLYHEVLLVGNIVNGKENISSHDTAPDSPIAAIEGAIRLLEAIREEYRTEGMEEHKEECREAKEPKKGVQRAKY